MNEQTWTPLTGFKHLVIRLFVRGIITIPILAFVIWLISFPLTYLPVSIAIIALMAVLLLPIGLSVGHIMSLNVKEISGMFGIPVAVVVVLFTLAVVYNAAYIARMFVTNPDWQFGICNLAIAIWATLWSVKKTWWDEL